MKKHMIGLLALAAISSASMAPAAYANGAPSPADVEVTRDNVARIVNVLQEAGFTRQEIKRWISASLDAHAGPNFDNIPSPLDIAVTRRNVDRIVNFLHEQGFTDQQVRRWINASINAHSSDNRGRNVSTERIDRALEEGIRTRVRRETRQVRGETPARRAERPARNVRAIRVARPQRPARVERATRPVRPVRAARPTRPGR